MNLKTIQGPSVRALLLGGAALLATLPLHARDRAPETAASRKESAEFRRFFLPPLEFKNASIEQALATLREACAAAAKATGQKAAPEFQVDLSAANQEKISLSTNGGTVTSTLRRISLEAGNELTGEYPNFQLKPLSDKPELSGEVPVSPDFLVRLAAIFPKLIQKEDSRSVLDQLRAVQMAGPESTASLKDGILKYEKISSRRLAMISTIHQWDASGDFGIALSKTNLKMITTTSKDDPVPESGKPLSKKAHANQMRQWAQTRGVDLVILPMTTSRIGEAFHLDIIKDVPDATGDDSTWSGFRVTGTSRPLGLANQLTLDFESRDEGRKPIAFTKTLTIPDQCTIPTVFRAEDGRAVVVMPEVTMVDAAGTALSDRR